MSIQYCPLCGKESTEQEPKKYRVPETLQQFIKCPEHGWAEITAINVNRDNLPDR